MKITAITPQLRDQDKVNLLLDGKFFCSLYISQIYELNIKLNIDYSDNFLNEVKKASEFGKIYSKALNYCLMRPHSEKELRDYLYRKMLPKKDKNGKTLPGISSELSEYVIKRLKEKGYIDDEKFAKFWIDSKLNKTGISRKKISFDLMKKGVSHKIADSMISLMLDEDSELDKIITKKKSKYTDQKKLIAYLISKGFNYSDIKSRLVLSDEDANLAGE